MSLSISFANATLPKTGSVILVHGKGAKLGAIGNQLDREAGGSISRAVKVKAYKGEKGSELSLLAPARGRDQIILCGVGAVNGMTHTDWEKLGGRAAALCGDGKSFCLVFEKGLLSKTEEAAARIALGAKLGDYKFTQYKTKEKKSTRTSRLIVASGATARAKSAYGELSAMADGVLLARDLVNEPANVLSPPEFAKRAKGLIRLGVKVEVLSEAQMKRLGMGALLGVGQGSAHPSQLVIMQWRGGAAKDKPLAFIGKGVCFDTGGISIKPSAGMEEMKGDMGGAAAVTGLMMSLAKRKAKVNVVGVIGLVENMPSSTAQRPGDIVTSMSGQTIEVLNTDAEGRLVLADALWYTQNRFKPRFMIDLATLTGAIMIALGQDYAGMFSNNDKLCAQLDAIGKAEGELVWRMPMNDNFDKMINTPNADMKNIGGRYAGSSTAAQFLERFVNKLPWVHLDIAGTAMGSPKSPISQSWASGFGVKLLDRFVRAHYE